MPFGVVEAQFPEQEPVTQSGTAKEPAGSEVASEYVAVTSIVPDPAEVACTTIEHQFV
jgi:hypothetical protein